MTDIVIRALTKKEAHDLRMIKLRLEERTWRTLILRIVKEWQSNRDEKLIAEEAEYILSFMEDSSAFCKTDDDYEFDENLKEKLARLVK